MILTFSINYDNVLLMNCTNILMIKYLFNSSTNKNIIFIICTILEKIFLNKLTYR